MAVGFPLRGPPCRPRPCPPRPRPGRAPSPSVRGLTRASELQRSALWQAAGAGEGAWAPGSDRAQRGAHGGCDGAVPVAARAAECTNLPSRNFEARAREPGERSEPQNLRSAERGAPELAGERALGTHCAPSAGQPSAQCWLPLPPRRARAGAAGRRGGRRGGGGGGGDGGGEAGARERALGERRPSLAAGACGPGAERGVRCCWRCCSAGTRG